MAFEEYDDKGFIFSDTPRRLAYESMGHSGAVSFTVQVLTVRKYEEKLHFTTDFELIPPNDSVIRLDLKGILQSLKPFLENMDFNTNTGLKMVRITARENEKTSVWQMYVQPGNSASGWTYYDDAEAVWNKRPQVAFTYKHGYETLYFLDRAREDYPLVLSVKVYFKIHAPIVIAIYDRGQGYPEAFPVFSFSGRGFSYQNILVWVRNFSVNEEVIAYDVFVNGREDTAMRYIVRDDPSVRVFVFRNSLGTYDTIYAVGQEKVSLEHETKTFLSNGLELETDNESVTVFESSTGYMASNDECVFWREFFKSDERYIVSLNMNSDTMYHTQHRIVIDEVSGDCTRMELGQMKFKWHYAEDTPEPEPEKHKLQPFMQMT